VVAVPLAELKRCLEEVMRNVLLSEIEQQDCLKTREAFNFYMNEFWEQLMFYGLKNIKMFVSA
jgi:hypothetical protein